MTRPALSRPEHDIKSGLKMIDAGVTAAPQAGGADQAHLLSGGYGQTGGVHGGAVLDLDESENAAAPGDEIKLSDPGAGAFVENSPALQTQPERADGFGSAPPAFSLFPDLRHSPASRCPHACPLRGRRLASAPTGAGRVSVRRGDKVAVMVENNTSKTGASRVLAGLVVLGGALVLGACTASTPSTPIQTAPDRPVVGAPPPPATLPVELADRGYTPAFLEGEPDIVRVALLLPFSASSTAARNEATQLLRAAELAVFERADSNLVLLPKDTGGSPDTARRAAQSAISDGADLIIGPLFQQAVAAAGEVAREADVPLLSLSSSSAVAGDGVYQLSFPPDEEVRRVTEYVGALGATRFAFIGPASAYGQVTQSAYAQTILDLLGEYSMPETVMIEEPVSDDEDAETRLVERTFDTGLVSSQFYDGGVSAMTEAAARLASYGVEELDPAEAATMSGANWTPSPASPFQVVLLPEGGDQLRMLAPVLLYQDIDPLLVKFIGTGQWLDNSLAREPALSNGWFAGPDPEARTRFETVYAQYYGAEPSRIAGLGYDAASLAALLADNGYGPDQLGAPDGFMGVDGRFRFRADGTIERGLAVYTVRGGGFRVLDPAPQRFGPPVPTDETDADKPVNEPAF